MRFLFAVGQQQVKIDCVEPLVELPPDLVQVRNLLKAELLVQPDAGALVRGDVREDGAKTLSTGGGNQFREEPAPNSLAVKIRMHIDRVFQGAGDRVGFSE